MDENVGFFSALWRFFTFYGLRKRMGLVRAADAMFTGSVGGISDAFDIHKDSTVRTYKGLRDAVAEVEGVSQADSQRLAELNTEEKTVLSQRDGALDLYEKAQAANDATAMAKHKAAFDRFDARIHEIEAEQAVLDQRIKDTQETMAGYMTQLTALQAEIARLPAEKARAIADFVSAKKIVELNDRLQGISTSIERGPIEAVLKANKDLTAKARISQKLAGTDVKRQDNEYLAAGRMVSSGDRMSQMLAARKAEKEAKTGVAAPAKVEERPQI